MKKVLIVLGHPRKGSFNHAIASTVAETLHKQGYEAILRDLYQEKFDPIYSAEELEKDYKPTGLLKTYLDEIVSVDGIVVIHPNYWGQPPAILKGWVDRVLRQGVAYRFGPDGKGGFGPIGLLKADRALVFTTSNTPEADEQALYGDPLENLWKNCIFGLCGIKKCLRKNFYGVIVSTPEKRKYWLGEVVQAVEDLF